MRRFEQFMTACLAIGIASQTFATDEKPCRSTPATVGAARPKVATIPHEKIMPSQLAAVYQDAYVEAGFTFKGKKKLDKYGGFALTFVFKVPALKAKGTGTIAFGVQLAEDGTCAPCEVHVQTMGITWPDGKDLDAEAYNKANQAIEAAHLQASARIKERLGRSLGDLVNQNPDTKPGPPPPC